MPRKPQTIDEFLALVSGEKRAALQKLRKDIKSVVPEAEECISYGVPAFRYRGRLLVGFGAGVNHCSFYPGASPIRVHQKDLSGYDTSKGTIRFPADKPLPVGLVRKLVKARVAENAARQGKRRGSP